MASDTASRPLMPQTGQEAIMGGSPVPKEPVQRNYVFVDEHNRHKRLKVMRACEGCRRRKIKCDSATTNTWPCAACTRLKLTCIPPTLSDENAPPTPGSSFEIQKSASFPTSNPTNLDDYPPHAMQHHFAPIETTLQPTIPNIYADVPVYQPGDYLDSPTGPEMAQYHGMPSTSLSMEHKDHMLYSPVQHVPQSAVSERSWMAEPGVTHLANAFGDLKIAPNAQAPYIADPTKLATGPAVEDYNVDLPVSIGPDNIVRIPHEMMPSEQQTLKYFEAYFTHIHPFAPVLCQAEFYKDWQYQRNTIPPLLLEAIFACAAAALEEEAECHKWLALAFRHEESYKDSPRLSTVQALILLLKAREAYPKRGYFYRSWNTLVSIVAMAKDLELDQHLDNHKNGIPCSNSVECVCKTRIWQLLYVLEAMIGGPQGRFNFGVSRDTINFEVPHPLPGIDIHEYHISRQFAYFLRLIGSIRRTIRAYKTLSKRMGEKYCVDPSYTELDNVFPQWLEELPSDLNVEIPSYAHQPWKYTAFLGNLHTYLYLAIIMHHRPQIHHHMNNLGTDGWKPYMIKCLDAAKKMTRIQESMLETLGMPAFISMLRGISYPIYCLLTCAMLHLVAVTAPDPDINNDARDYFVRCMRLLEICTSAWKMDTVVEQINALREAFSANVNKPFELKADFPFGSPQTQTAELPTIVSPMGYQHAHETPYSTTGQVSFALVNPLTPPKSTTDEDIPADSPIHQSVGISHPASNAQPPLVPAQWNPSRIWDKWSTAFYMASATNMPPSEHSPTLSNVGSASDFDVPQHDLPPTPYSPAGYSPESGQFPATQMPAPTSNPSYNFELVTPSAWQDAVASSYVPRAKRRLDYSDPTVAMGKHMI